MADYELTHPNRDKVECKATKSIVVLLLLVSAALVALITIGGWSVLQGAQFVSIAYIVLCVVMAFYVARWNRGVLPVAAAFAVFYAVVAGISGPAWFDRDKPGFAVPALDPGLLGLLTMLLIPIQVLLLAFALRAFAQKWNVELEVRRDERPGDWNALDDTQPAGA